MPSPIAPDVVYKLNSVGDPALSPDGSLLAYTLSWVDTQKLEGRSRIMLMDLESGQTVEFTWGQRDVAPKFSPDCQTLGFLRPDENDKRQVWLMGTRGGEARRLTSLAGGASDLAWSPGGARLLVCSDVPEEPPDRDGLPESTPRVTEIHRIRYRFDTLGWRGDAHFHLFTVNVADGETRQLTDGDWDDYAGVWSPDGSLVAFISGRRDDRDILALTEAYVVPASGGEAELWSEGLYGVGGLAWSPEGDKLLAAATDVPTGLVSWQSWLYIIQPGHSPERITDDSIKPFVSFPPMNPGPSMRWQSDGRILFLGERWGESYLFEANAGEVGVHELYGGSRQTSGLALDRNARRAVEMSASPASPGDLLLLDLDTGASKQLTDVNAEYLAECPPATMEKFTFERGGLVIESRLWFPPDFDPSWQYPLVVDIHGGPNGAFYDAFATVQQVLATAGCLVLAVNPRGSSTYGDEFMNAVLEDWGGEDHLDLMAAVDLVAERPYVDSARLGIHGYSYGGYMTSWTLGHTDRFVAGVVGRALHQFVQHVRHVRHRYQLRRGPVGRDGGRRLPRAVIPLTYHLRGQRHRAGAAAPRRVGLPLPYIPERGVLHAAEAAGQGGGVSSGSPARPTPSPGLGTRRCERSTSPARWAGSRSTCLSRQKTPFTLGCRSTERPPSGAGYAVIGKCFQVPLL